MITSVKYHSRFLLYATVALWAAGGLKASYYDLDIWNAPTRDKFIKPLTFPLFSTLFGLVNAKVLAVVVSVITYTYV